MALCDAGAHSATAVLLRLCSAGNLNDFDEVVDFLKYHIDDVIQEVHSFDKLLVDDGVTSLNAPPEPEKGDNHGGLLIRTLSEVESEEHPILKREFKVHDLSNPESEDLHKIEIRCDVTRRTDEGDQINEQKTVVEVRRRRNSSCVLSD